MTVEGPGSAPPQLALEDARVLCRLIDEAIDDLSVTELAAWDRLCAACGYVEWMQERIAAGRVAHDAEMDAMFITLGLCALAFS